MNCGLEPFCYIYDILLWWIISVTLYIIWCCYSFAFTAVNHIQCCMGVDGTRSMWINRLNIPVIYLTMTTVLCFGCDLSARHSQLYISYDCIMEWPLSAWLIEFKQLYGKCMIDLVYNIAWFGTSRSWRSQYEPLLWGQYSQQLGSLIHVWLVLQISCHLLQTACNFPQEPKSFVGPLPSSSGAVGPASLIF